MLTTVDFSFPLVPFVAVPRPCAAEQMPKMDGFEATKQIRQLEELAKPPTHLPIVGLTAHAMAGYKNECYNAGMDGYATKPFKLDRLVAAIRAVIGGEREVDATAS